MTLPTPEAFEALERLFKSIADSLKGDPRSAQEYYDAATACRIATKAVDRKTLAEHLKEVNTTNGWDWHPFEQDCALADAVIAYLTDQPTERT